MKVVLHPLAKPAQNDSRWLQSNSKNQPQHDVDPIFRRLISFRVQVGVKVLGHSDGWNWIFTILHNSSISQGRILCIYRSIPKDRRFPALTLLRASLVTSRVAESEV